MRHSTRRRRGTCQGGCVCFLAQNGRTGIGAEVERRRQLNPVGRVQAAQGLLAARHLQPAAAVAEAELAAHAACDLGTAGIASLGQQNLHGRHRSRRGQGRGDAMLIHHVQAMPQQRRIREVLLVGHRQGAASGDYLVWIECDAGEPDGIRIPVAWTPCSAPRTEAGFRPPRELIPGTK